MKVPVNCPVCGDPLLNIFPPAEDFGNKVTKYCYRRVDHRISMIVEDNEVSQLSVDLADGTEAIFLFLLDKIWVQNTIYSKSKKNMVVLPFFEPDLSNYKKLVAKIKTYLVFS